MSRGLRFALVLAAVVLVVGGLGYAAHSFNVVGMIVNAHAPPQHG